MPFEALAKNGLCVRPHTEATDGKPTDHIQKTTNPCRGSSVVERRTENPCVASSILALGTTFNSPSGRSADGSASGLGPEGRRFEPCRPDHKNRDPWIAVFVLTDA
jgi:hypothetical protein